MKSFDSVLAETQGIGRGFDFLRIFLATFIVAIHAVLLTGNRETFNASYFWFLEYALVPMFFALSGFLITGSASRLTLGNFLVNRGLRIVPALAVDVFVCALLIGPLMTTVSLEEYFHDRDFYKYFLNISGYIHYHLPGVFEQNPNTKVNGALWTVPYEILCYIFMSAFMLLGWLKGKWKVLSIAAIMMTLGTLLSVTEHADSLPHRIDTLLNILTISRGSQIVTAFLLGVVAYQWKERLPYDWRLFTISIAICCAGAAQPEMAQTIAARFVLLPAIVYMTIFIGLTHVKIPAYFTRGDYSYGIYLYHDPFLQIIIALLPALALAHLEGALLVFIMGYPIALAVSNVSWHLIEKPVLRLRKKFSFVSRLRDLNPATATVNPVESPAQPVDTGQAS